MMTDSHAHWLARHEGVVTMYLQNPKRAKNTFALTYTDPLTRERKSVGGTSLVHCINKANSLIRVAQNIGSKFDCKIAAKM